MREYNDSLCKVKKTIDLLYHEFIMHLEEKGEITHQYKLFLHVLYEVESAIVFFKDVFLLEFDKTQELLQREVNPHRRTFDKIWDDLPMTEYFDHLLIWFEERSQEIQSSTNSLLLVRHVQRVFFSLFDRRQEYAFYSMNLTKIYRKTSPDILFV
jgi:hypothetical protein